MAGEVLPDAAVPEGAAAVVADALLCTCVAAGVAFAVCWAVAAGVVVVWLAEDAVHLA